MARIPLVKSIKIGTGVGYGDEGKGVTTKWLASKNSSCGLVVRYGGGNQVGHTVIGDNGVRHVHHHTGSGTLEGVPTFYSRFCTVDPIGVLNECAKIKREHHLEPVLIYDPRCMIVTPLDVRWNQGQHEKNYHGTVGVGFGATIDRNENHYRLSVADIANKDIFQAKLKQIIRYYTVLGIVQRGDILENTWDDFYDSCKQFYDTIICTTLNHYLRSNKHINTLIFEGHQGILLDMEYGVFPHVTRSKTTCKNAYTIIKEEVTNYDKIRDISNVLITRCYHTRHGNGDFKMEPIELINNENETNVHNPWQGEFKVSKFDISLFHFALNCNMWDTPSDMRPSHDLIITCADQISYQAFDEMYAQIRESFHFRCIYKNTSPSIQMTQLK